VEACDGQILDTFDPRIQRLAEQIKDGKSDVEQKTASGPSSMPPSVSREYALLQAAPPPIDPDAGKTSTSDALSPQSSAIQPALAPLTVTPPTVAPPKITSLPAVPAKPPKPKPSDPPAEARPPQASIVEPAKELPILLEVPAVGTQIPERIPQRSEPATVVAARPDAKTMPIWRSPSWSRLR